MSNLRGMFNKPGKYFGTLFNSLRATWGSRRFFIGVLAFFPKSVYLAELMTQHGINHIHAHFASFPAASAYMINQMSGIPYSFTAHGSDLHRDQHMLCEKVAAAKFVVAISQYNRQVIVDHCGESVADRLLIVHCGVDTSVFAPGDTAQNEDETERLKIVCTGTLHEVKGQKYLLQACAQLKQRGVDFQLEFVGDGPDEEMLCEMVTELGLADNVIFHGRVQRTEVIRILQGADIVALPSVPTQDGRREGIPVALMEAMSFGAPVVASELSGIPELVEKDVSGLLVPPKDVDGIARELERLANDPELRAKLGTAGRQRILDQFDLEKNAIQLTELFKEAQAL